MNIVLSILILTVVLSAVAYVGHIHNTYRRFDESIRIICMVMFFILLIVSPIIVPAIAKCIGGVTDIGNGIVDGVVLRVNNEGLYYTTYEVKLIPNAKLNIAEMELSSPEDFPNTPLQSLVGKTVHVEYRINYLTPYKEGDSKNVITSINLIPPVLEKTQ